MVAFLETDSMTSKRKRDIKKLRTKTGMSHQAAHNLVAVLGKQASGTDTAGIGSLSLGKAFEALSEGGKVGEYLKVRSSFEYRYTTIKSLLDDVERKTFEIIEVFRTPVEGGKFTIEWEDLPSIDLPCTFGIRVRYNREDIEISWLFHIKLQDFKDSCHELSGNVLEALKYRMTRSDVSAWYRSYNRQENESLEDFVKPALAVREHLVKDA